MQPYPVLSEVLYAASRIYSVAGFAEHNRMALDLVLWIKNVTEVTEITLDIALRAGELKKLLGIALTDCYVIATAETLNATALFLKIEEEMKKRMHLIEKLPVEFIVEAL
uniref:PIN domain-containing protein n=1 Tax=Ignisphaera aggregans TaxID=334771 RepID=A0A7J2U0E1_9CREN